MNDDNASVESDNFIGNNISVRTLFRYLNLFLHDVVFQKLNFNMKAWFYRK